MALGTPAVKAISGMKQDRFLSDPQDLNLYTYSRNNPILLKDITGQAEINIFAFLPEKVQVSIGNWANNLYDNNSVARYAMDHPYQTGIAAGLGAGAVVTGGVLVGGGSITCGVICGGGAAAVGTAVGTQADKIQEETKTLNAPINISPERLTHVLDEHAWGGAKTFGNSIFNKGEDVVNLIREGTQQVVEKQARGDNFQRIFDAGRNIGIDRVTNKATSVMTIITNKAGDLITAFPGRPNY